MQGWKDLVPYILLLSILILASFLFLYRLDEIFIEPDNVPFYTAIASLDIMRRGNFPLYLPELGFPQVMPVYLRALSVVILGGTTLSVRFPVAILGIFTAFYTFLLARELLSREEPFARDTGALFASLAWVVSSLPIQLVRSGIGASLVRPDSVLALAPQGKPGARAVLDWSE